MLYGVRLQTCAGAGLARWLVLGCWQWKFEVHAETLNVCAIGGPMLVYQDGLSEKLALGV